MVEWKHCHLVVIIRLRILVLANVLLACVCVSEYYVNIDSMEQICVSSQKMLTSCNTLFVKHHKRTKMQPNWSRLSGRARRRWTLETPRRQTETDGHLLWSVEDVLLPTEHGRSRMSRALTPRLWTI